MLDCLNLRTVIKMIKTQYFALKITLYVLYVNIHHEFV